MATNLKVVEYLLKDELKWELEYRGIPTSDLNCSQMRARLRPLLKLEKGNSSLKYPKYNYDYKTEMAGIEAKYKELVTKISELEDNGDDRDFNRINSRCLHLLERINAPPITAKADEVSSRGIWLGNTLSHHCLVCCEKLESRD